MQPFHVPNLAPLNLAPPAPHTQDLPTPTNVSTPFSIPHPRPFLLPTAARRNRSGTAAWRSTVGSKTPSRCAHSLPYHFASLFRSPMLPLHQHLCPRSARTASLHPPPPTLALTHILLRASLLSSLALPLPSCSSQARPRIRTNKYNARFPASRQSCRPVMPPSLPPLSIQPLAQPLP